MVCFLHYRLQSGAFAVMYKHRCCFLCGQSAVKAFAKWQRKISGLGTSVDDKHKNKLVLVGF